MHMNIALLRGDGIGPEIVDSAVEVLKKVGEQYGHTFTFTNNEVNGCTIAGDHNWFQFNASAGTVVMSGNTKDGAAWTPGVAEGLK